MKSAEGKIGPGLNDDYWTYPKNVHDQGIFETVYGGARAMMGPHNGDLTLDQFMQVIAWVRHLYKDPVNQAFWLTDAQKKNYKPYTLGGRQTYRGSSDFDARPVPGGGSARKERTRRRRQRIAVSRSGHALLQSVCTRVKARKVEENA